jgi:hypothetical protein
MTEKAGGMWTTADPDVSAQRPGAQCVLVKGDLVAVTYQQTALEGPCGTLLKLGWREDLDREDSLFESGHP